jgi:hypothetical protein
MRDVAGVGVEADGSLGVLEIAEILDNGILDDIIVVVKMERHGKSIRVGQEAEERNHGEMHDGPFKKSHMLFYHYIYIFNRLLLDKVFSIVIISTTFFPETTN